MTFSRVCSATDGTPVSASVSAGNAMWWIRSRRETSAAWTPMGAEKPRGNQPSATENTMRATMPTQKAGVDDSTMHAPWIPQSTGSSRWIPATMPSSTPMTPESTHAVSMSAHELAKRSPTTWATGAL